MRSHNEYKIRVSGRIRAKRIACSLDQLRLAGYFTALAATTVSDDASSVGAGRKA